MFMKAEVYIQGIVYARTCDLQDIIAVFVADFHKTCIWLWLKKYDGVLVDADHITDGGGELEA